jgi:hypothetical protein
MSKTSVFKSLREGKIERHSSAIKPYLTDENKKTRVQHALNMLEPSSIPHQPVFRLMYNVVHAGEKWYYITRKTQFDGHCRPWFNEKNECIFDGKIGIYPFVITEPAKRKSPNRTIVELISQLMTLSSVQQHKLMDGISV